MENAELTINGKVVEGIEYTSLEFTPRGLGMNLSVDIKTETIYDGIASLLGKFFPSGPAEHKPIPIVIGEPPVLVDHAAPDADETVEIELAPAPNAVAKGPITPDLIEYKCPVCGLYCETGWAHGTCYTKREGPALLPSYEGEIVIE